MCCANGRLPNITFGSFQFQMLVQRLSILPQVYHDFLQSLQKNAKRVKGVHLFLLPHLQSTHLSMNYT